MKVHFEDEAAQLLNEYYPGKKFDLNCEHVTTNSARFYYDDEFGIEYQVSLDVVELDSENLSEADAVDIEWTIYARKAGTEDWYNRHSDTKEIDLF